MKANKFVSNVFKKNKIKQTKENFRRYGVGYRVGLGFGFLLAMLVGYFWFVI